MTLEHFIPTKFSFETLTSCGLSTCYLTHVYGNVYRLIVLNKESVELGDLLNICQDLFEYKGLDITIIRIPYRVGNSYSEIRISKKEGYHIEDYYTNIINQISFVQPNPKD